MEIPLPNVRHQPLVDYLQVLTLLLGRTKSRSRRLTSRGPTTHAAHRRPSASSSMRIGSGLG